MSVSRQRLASSSASSTKNSKTSSSSSKKLDRVQEEQQEVPKTDEEHDIKSAKKQQEQDIKATTSVLEPSSSLPFLTAKDITTSNSVKTTTAKATAGEYIPPLLHPKIPSRSSVTCSKTVLSTDLSSGRGRGNDSVKTREELSSTYTWIPPGASVEEVSLRC